MFDAVLRGHPDDPVQFHPVQPQPVDPLRIVVRQTGAVYTRVVSQDNRLLASHYTGGYLSHIVSIHQPQPSALSYIVYQAGAVYAGMVP